MYVSPRPLELLQPDDLFEEPERDLPDYQDTTGSGGGGFTSVRFGMRRV